MRGVDWSDPEAIGRLRVADFACGTGALLSAVYEQIAARYERTGGSPRRLAPGDDGGGAVRLRRYPLSRPHHRLHSDPASSRGIGFEDSRVYNLPYGRQPDGGVKIGSLELLQSSGAILTLFNTSDPAQRTGSAGEETATQIIAEMPDKSYDLVIMNPPFTRAGSDWEGSGRQEDYIKQFRGLSTTLETQTEMSQQLRRYAKGTCTHGYAGIASAFAALADKKLRYGGVLALVMPSIRRCRDLSWQGFRADAGEQIYGLDRPEHCGKWQRNVVFVRYRHGGMSGSSPQTQTR